jgi:hypothetical protein
MISLRYSLTQALSQIQEAPHRYFHSSGRNIFDVDPQVDAVIIAGTRLQITSAKRNGLTIWVKERPPREFEFLLDYVIPWGL